MNEKWDITLGILRELKTMPEVQRTAWRQMCVDQIPDSEKFVDAALEVAKDEKLMAAI